MVAEVEHLLRHEESCQDEHHEEQGDLDREDSATSSPDDRSTFADVAGDSVVTVGVLPRPE
ncbi:MAG: hypothetical protein ACRDV8_00570, partial [Acidimicrobiales bacterium]